MPETPTFCPASRPQWREWLATHHASEVAVWLVYHKKQSPGTGISYAEAVEEALCFGWIDSRAQPLDAHTYRQFFSRRKPGSTWSAVNKARVERLQATGQLAPAGLAAIELARQNGSWALLDEVEALVVPPDLAAALAGQPVAQAYFERLSKSAKKMVLLRLMQARQPATRQRRVAELLALASQPGRPA